MRLRADRNLLQLIDSHSTRPPQALDDYLRADSLLHVLFHFFQDLAGQHYDRGRAVANLSILTARYVD